jgi:hypothetical protein
MSAIVVLGAVDSDASADDEALHASRDVARAADRQARKDEAARHAASIAAKRHRSRLEVAEAIAAQGISEDELAEYIDMGSDFSWAAPLSRKAAIQFLSAADDQQPFEPQSHVPDPTEPLEVLPPLEPCIQEQQPVQHHQQHEQQVDQQRLEPQQLQRQQQLQQQLNPQPNDNNDQSVSEQLEPQSIEPDEQQSTEQPIEQPSQQQSNEQQSNGQQSREQPSSSSSTAMQRFELYPPAQLFDIASDQSECTESEPDDAEHDSNATPVEAEPDDASLWSEFHDSDAQGLQQAGDQQPHSPSDEGGRPAKRHRPG